MLRVENFLPAKETRYFPLGKAGALHPSVSTYQENCGRFASETFSQQKKRRYFPPEHNIPVEHQPGGKITVPFRQERRGAARPSDFSGSYAK